MSNLETFLPGEKVTANSVNHNFSFIENKINQAVISYEPPLGIISPWSGNFSSIPAGWSVCNGENGTPDLRDRFVVGAGDSYSLGETGGQNAVSLSENQIPSHSHALGSLSSSSAGEHTHTYNRWNDFRGRQSGGSTSLGWRNTQTLQTGQSGAHTHGVTGSTALSGDGQPHENRPPYYALYYIMATG